MGAREVLAEARRALGIDQLVLSVFDASFPSAAGEDVGRGSPYSRGAQELVEFALDLGFTGVQLGPQGETTLGNRSPYDGTAFAKSVLSIDFASLARDRAWAGVVDPALVRRLVAGRPEGAGEVHYRYAFHAVRDLVRACESAFHRAASPALRARFDAFRAANAAWLDHDEAYERATGALAMGDAFAFGQFLVHQQHAALLARCEAEGWTLFGDLQIGLSLCDRWRRDDELLAGYAMGAPPSRTDPSGQAWGYPVFDPLGPRAKDSGLLGRRIDKMLAETTGLRIDHPHGLVDPWVYGSPSDAPLASVQGGARLFSSPDLADHPRLAAYAIVRPDQIDRSKARHADGWVRDLDEAQVTAFGARIQRIVDGLRARGRDPRSLMCEVLSTQPYPLCRVMERHGLGRFRVTQKSSPDDASDVYRSENAKPEDWILVGNHDTAPLLAVVDGWQASGRLADRARLLADRLRLDAASLAEDPRRVAQAMFAELFASPARNVMVFAPDLLGERVRFNRPGVVDEVNWTWRVPHDFRAVYAENRAAGEAMDVHRALAAALRVKGAGTREARESIDALEQLAKRG